jgi:hypothetical protein
MEMGDVETCRYPGCVMIWANAPIGGELDLVGTHVHPDEGEDVLEALMVAMAEVHRDIVARRILVEQAN